MTEQAIDISLFFIRSYQPEDQDRIMWLWHHGLLKGQIAGDERANDLKSAKQFYLDHPRHHLWVAEFDNKVVGMIAVAEGADHIAEIRRLRIDPEYQNPQLTERLVEKALMFVRHHGFLKVVLSTRVDLDSLTPLIERCAFQEQIKRKKADRERLEFYVDLYREATPSIE